MSSIILLDCTQTSVSICLRIWSVWQLSLHVHDSAGQFIPVEACVKSELHPAHPKSFCPQVLLRAPGDEDWGEERALHGGDQSCQR